MMTAMLKSSNSHSESDDSDSPHSPLAKTHIPSSDPKPRPPTYHTNIKTKILNLKNKTPMPRSSPNSSPTKPLSSSVLHSAPTDPTQSFNTEDSSPTPPNYNSHLLSHNNLSPRPPQISSLSSPLYLHKSPPPDTLIVIILLPIPPYITSGNRLKFIPLLHRQLKLTTSL